MTQDELYQKNLEHIKSAISNIEKRAGCSKKELSVFLGTSIASINRSLSSGVGLPGYIKRPGTKGQILFPLHNICEYLTESTIKTA